MNWSYFKIMYHIDYLTKKIAKYTEVAIQLALPLKSGVVWDFFLKQGYFGNFF